MSIVSALVPAEATLPALQVIAAHAMTIVRPLLGLGLLAAVLVAFKPLLVGLLRASLLVIKPRQTSEQRSARERLQSLLTINRVARDVELAHPALASELRALAARS